MSTPRVDLAKTPKQPTSLASDGVLGRRLAGAERRPESCEIAGLLPSPQALRDILRDFSIRGFGANQISALAMNGLYDERLTDGRAGRFIPLDEERAARIEPATMAAPLCIVRVGCCDAIVAGGGRLAFALAALLLADLTDAGLGDVLAATVNRDYQEAIATQLAAGGALLWVRSKWGSRLDEVSDALHRHGASCVHRVDRSA